jgi:hypothetical protein
MNHVGLWEGVHVWTSTMVIFEDIFPNFLHNMVDYNTRIQSQWKFFFNLYFFILKYIYGKKCTSLCTKKCKYTQKMIEMIFSFLKLVTSIKHCDSMWWNKFVNHVKSLIIIISQMGVFWGDDHKYVAN